MQVRKGPVIFLCGIMMDILISFEFDELHYEIYGEYR